MCIRDRCGVDVNDACTPGETAAHMLAKAGRADLLEWLLDSHGLVHTPLICVTQPPRLSGPNGDSPLHIAALSKRWVVCLLYTSDAADDLLCVDLGGRRIIKKKQQRQHIRMSSVVHRM
eukprot:TRINITY_DN1440_c0_g1_i1.p1 TRINITY_DN1440_c0_g1~~TRINITY_DN1440_c0_g1_i1.p1  ORF type:complete len:119 (+),score=38.16 TRINITY_DN1440_c0_g1_i1:125-481(+)